MHKKPWTRVHKTRYLTYERSGIRASIVMQRIIEGLRISTGFLIVKPTAIGDWWKVGPQDASTYDHMLRYVDEALKEASEGSQSTYYYEPIRCWCM